VRTYQRLAVISFTILAMAIVVGPLRAQPTASLVVHVKNMSPKGGMLRLGLYDEAHYPDDASAPTASADVPAQIGETVITLNNIPPGTYAIEAYQDINSNNKMDLSFFGLPLEPFGFSRDARPRFSKPDFAQVKIEVAVGTNVQTLSLQNSISLFAAD
jgi:uncharacterized protein (DUF2141 family)